MSDRRPGLNRRRLLTLMQAAIQRCELDLNGMTVLTEAATGAYVVTPVLAAMAGAKQVFAISRTSRYGSIEQVRHETVRLAELAQVSERIEIVTQKSRDVVSGADIITNSGHVRPIDAEMVSWMKPTAVIPLMYEAWEFRTEDIDLDACHQRGIAVAGTNECHPNIDVFKYLGIMAVKLLLDAGVAVYGSCILLLCDNPFRPFIERGLTHAGADVEVAENMLAVKSDRTWDAILVALRPQPGWVLSDEDLTIIRSRAPGVVVAQFWGDLDRSVMPVAKISIWPLEPPSPGHMGILPSAVGPEPIVRLQSGGLKVGELLWRARSVQLPIEDAIRAVVNSGFGEPIDSRYAVING